MIKIMIVDDQQIIREGLKMMLSLDENMDVIDDFEDASKLLQALEVSIPDIILMDIRMPNMNGVEGTKIIKEKHPNIKVIILTTFNEDEYIFEVLKNGADGYLLKDSDSDSLISAIKTVHSGNMLLHPQVATKVIQSFNGNSNNSISLEYKLDGLTSRELEIAYLIKDGLSNKEISTKLFITEGTVKNHISNLLCKLNLDSRARLINYMSSN